MLRMNQLGITTRTSRNAAMLRLASTTPPAVVAHLLGVSIGAATRWAQLAGSNWMNYTNARGSSRPRADPSLPSSDRTYRHAPFPSHRTWGSAYLG